MSMNQMEGHINGHMKGWQRMRNWKTTRRTGFTLIEAIVVIVIIGIIATLIAPRLFNRIGMAKREVAVGNAKSIAVQMHVYTLDCGMPEAGTTVMVLWEKPPNVPEGSWHGPYVSSVDDLKDPWGNLFILRIPPQQNVDFDIVSLGADGREGGEGDDADIVNGKK